MARNRVLDLMQTHKFWLADISLSPVPVFLPILGFSSISAPHMSAQVEEFKEGNWFFPRKVITAAAVESITATRAVSIYDSDFWNWIVECVSGDPGSLSNAAAGALSQAGGLLADLSGAGDIRKRLLLIHFTGMEVAGVPVPGKAWILHEALAVGYKPASDFDAKSGEVSLQELEIAFEYFEEFAISA